MYFNTEPFILVRERNDNREFKILGVVMKSILPPEIAGL